MVQLSMQYGLNNLSHEPVACSNVQKATAGREVEEPFCEPLQRHGSPSSFRRG